MKPKWVLVGLVTLLVVDLCILIGLVVKIITGSSNDKCTGKSAFRQGTKKNRIVGGKPVPISASPFMAGIVIKKHGDLPEDALQCGCSIISTKWVVTAAHCLVLINDQGFGKELVYISSGSSQWRIGHEHDVAEWVYHEHYDKDSLHNDIALVSVKQPFSKKNEKPVPIASKAYPYTPNTKVKIIGWGLKRESDKVVQAFLHGVDVNIIDQSHCAAIYKPGGSEVTSSMFCAGELKGGKDACQYDSGGPIFEHNLLIGVVSWGVDCGVANQPGVYTRIALYGNWIKMSTKKLGDPITATFKAKP